MADESERLIDEILVLDCQSGREEALHALVKRWQKRFWRHALYLTGNSEAAWDVTQEGWLGIVRGISTLRQPARFREWGFRIVTNKARDWIKTKQRTTALELDNSPTPEAAGELDRTSDSADVLYVLGRLTSDSRVILTLYYFEGLQVRDVAEVLGIPIGTAKSRLHNARNEFREVWQTLCEQ